jgi:hypothetical protein
MTVGAVAYAIGEKVVGIDTAGFRGGEDRDQYAGSDRAADLRATLTSPEIAPTWQLWPHAIAIGEAGDNEVTFGDHDHARGSTTYRHGWWRTARFQTPCMT